MRIALLHGWGFDAGVWDALAPMLPGQMIRLDRGYFGAAADCGRPDVMIGHSLGAMLLARRWPDVPLVAINGFDRFCGPDAVAPRIVERMAKRFAQDAARVLDDFRAGIDAPPAPPIVSRESLSADLALLGDQTAAGRHGAPLLVLQSGDDPLLPAILREKTFGGAAAQVCPDGGHMLPVTQATWCAGHIRAFMR